MTAEERDALARAVLDRAGNGVEVSVQTQRHALTRFVRGSVNQNVDETDTVVRVRAIVDGRTGVAATNALDDRALDEVVARARAVAALAPRESIPPQLAAGPAVAAPAGAYDAPTAQAGASDRARVAAALFAPANDELWASGYAHTAHDGITIATSAGAHQRFDGTTAAANVKMNGTDSTGFAEAYATQLARVDGAALGARAARIANDTRTPRAVEPGEWTVILAPAAVGELLHYVVDHFSAESYSDGSSFVAGNLGTPVLGENVTLRDDFAHPLNPGMPFDFEGFPTARLTLVDAGVAREIVTDATWAQRLDRPNTGHALPAPNSDGPQVRSAVLEPGSTPLAELIAGTARGLLITRLWYVRVVDVRSVLLTGMTRDGTYLIENGKLCGGVRNLRFNQSMVAALRDCELGDTPQRTGGYSYSLVTPPVKFRRFHFASAAAY